MTGALIALALLIAVVVWVARGLGGNTFLGRRGPARRTRRERDEIEALLQMVGGHRPTAKRLIREEREKRPELDVAAAARSARRRLEADRR